MNIHIDRIHQIVKVAHLGCHVGHIVVHASEVVSDGFDTMAHRHHVLGHRPLDDIADPEQRSEVEVTRNWFRKVLIPVRSHDHSRITWCTFKEDLMAFPEHADYVIIGAGIHGVSTAWKLAERLAEATEEV